MPGPVGLMRAARAAQVARDRDAADRLAQAYFRTWQQIKSELEHLTSLIDDTEKVPVSWLYREQRLAKFQAQVAQKIWQYATFAHETVRQEVQQAAHDGAQAALDALTATLPEGISYSFNRLSVSAINKLIAETEKGGRLDKLFGQFAPDAAKRAKDALIQGFSLGDSPAELARRLRDNLNIPLSRAMTISRTESLRAYNSANMALYQANSDVCDSFQWLCGADPCPECAAVQNEIFKLGDDAPPLHPNCRCSCSPVTKSWDAILGRTVLEATGDDSGGDEG